MISPKVQSNDNERVKVLSLYHVSDAESESDFIYIAELARSVCQTDISLVSFIDEKTQWFKAHPGTELDRNTREMALCSHAINEPKQTTYIPNLTHDIRFKYHPLVTGPTNLKFYAGVPILSREGYALGTVCVMDKKPKNLNTDQLRALVHLKDFTQQLLEIRRNKREG